MVRRTKYKLRSKKFANNVSLGTSGGNHGRLQLPIVTTGGGKRNKRMIRSSTRIRPGITARGGSRKSKKILRSGIRRKNIVRSSTRIRPGITAVL